MKILPVKTERDQLPPLDIREFSIPCFWHLQEHFARDPCYRQKMRDSGGQRLGLDENGVSPFHFF